MMARMTRAAVLALALGAAAIAAGAAEAQARGGGHGGGGAHGAYAGRGGGYAGSRGYGGYRGYDYGGGYWGRGAYWGYGAPYYGYGVFGLAPWAWFPPAAYAPGYYDDYVYEDDIPPPPAYDPAPAPAPEPPPPAPPAPRAEAASRSFIVYFPFDQAELTEQAERVVQDAAAYDARIGGGRVTVVGYTDAAGAEGYNEALSQHRSQVVREALAAAGVQESRVNMAWRGEHDQAVPTPAGVKEPANRRVTIVIRPASAQAYRSEAYGSQAYGRQDDEGDDPGETR